MSTEELMVFFFVFVFVFFELMLLSYGIGEDS